MSQVVPKRIHIDKYYCNGFHPRDAGTNVASCHRGTRENCQETRVVSLQDCTRSGKESLPRAFTASGDSRYRLNPSRDPKVYDPMQSYRLVIIGRLISMLRGRGLIRTRAPGTVVA